MKVYSSSLTGDGDSTIFKVYSEQGTNEIERIGFTLNGTWNSATVKLYVCMAPDISPQVFTHTCDTSGTALSYTDDASGILDLPDGTLIKATVSGSGSPVPAIEFTLRGDVAKA